MPGLLQVFRASALASCTCLPSPSQLLGLVPGLDASLSSFFTFWMALFSDIKPGTPHGQQAAPFLPSTAASSSLPSRPPAISQCCGTVGAPFLKSRSISLCSTLRRSDTTRERQTQVERPRGSQKETLRYMQRGIQVSWADTEPLRQTMEQETGMEGVVRDGVTG